MDCNFTDKMLKKQLCKYISVENWDKIVELHIESDQRAFKISIDSYTGDTAFLQAISNAREEIVKRLVGLLTRDESRVSEAKEIMNFTNEKRRTPLHAAAATGNAQICKIIATIDESVVFARDYKGETPVFRAVRYGRAEAFYYLNSLAIVHRDQTFGSIKYCWNDDDQTILHNAIIRENFVY
ncbi:hypothetical protein TIFTF001_025075 [Ficus carica]|uniref:Ankyrin repeat protein n=1 Tax=Ficus carica TaxID=3494 RepID=A0AA88AYH2_FICCA|nr:hypothetical protein TIFTF001_025075 [Ficus carica]